MCHFKLNCLELKKTNTKHVFPSSGEYVFFLFVQTQKKNNIKLLTSVQSESQQVNNTTLLLPNLKSVQNRSVKLLQVFQPGEIISCLCRESREGQKNLKRHKQIKNVKKAENKPENKPSKNLKWVSGGCIITNPRC